MSSEARERILPPAPKSRDAERVVVALLGLAAVCAIAFVVVDAVTAIPRPTQFLGLSLGLAFISLAAAGLVVARRLVAAEELEDDYPAEAPTPDEAAVAATAEIAQLLVESGDGFTRRRLLLASATAAGASLGAALIAPLASFGPVFNLGSFVETPWRRGVPLVDEEGNPLALDQIEEGSFYTAYPLGAEREQLGAPLVLVRLPRSQLHLPAGRESWAPHGVLAYSKICTHAGCAISLYRKPTFEALEPPAALVCPCHYSTFDPARGGKVLFGPAGRPLPQLPLEAGPGGELRAAGNFSGPVGPGLVGRALEEVLVIRAAISALERAAASAPRVRRVLRYLFPDHWSFLLGEVALYAFVVLVATGAYLLFFFQDSSAQTHYYGPYRPLYGQEMTLAYKSVLDLSFSVRAGLLMRQTHHWAANVFIAAVVLHLLRVFFTGAFRKPRRLTYYLGLTMLIFALLEGYLGYSLADDLLSGMGLVIGYSVLLAVPLVGANLGALAWGGPFPGSAAFWPRIYILHVLVLPLLIGALLAAHLALVALRHHTQFRESERTTERKIVGVPAFPGQVPRSLALMFAVSGVLLLLGGLVQINPIWLWGPYHVGASTNGAQPDWYLGWLIGALRLVPGWDLVIAHRTIVPNPFWGGVLFPSLVFGLLFFWPSLERLLSGDREPHNLLQRPRENPWRTAIGAALLTWVVLIFAAGSADRVTVLFGLDYATQLDVYRVIIWVIPALVFVVTKRICRELVEGDRVARLRRQAEAPPEPPGELHV